MKIQMKEMNDLGFESIHPFCRHLVKNGENSDDSLEVYRGEMLCINVPNIGKAAEWTLVESDKKGFYFKRYSATEIKRLEAWRSIRVSGH